MKTEIMIAVLGIICIGSLAAAFVLWAKLDEQRKATAEEHECYLAVLKLHNTMSEHAQKMESKMDSLEWYSKRKFDEVLEAKKAAKTIQDKLSAVICPANNHIWKDGRCVKCGRRQDA